MRKFILLYGPDKSPLSPGGLVQNGIIFSKKEAEDRLNKVADPDLIEVLEISTKPVEIVINKRSIV